jgi:ABC-type dipeptide/oligopeptide/nickel transport system permease subunit
MTDPASPLASTATASTPETAAIGAPPTGAEAGREASASLWADARRSLIRNPIAVASALFVVVVCSMAAIPRLWTGTDPELCELGIARQGPTGAHPFGTTELGCDVYAQVIYGARPSILVAVFSTLGILVIGGVLGIVAGFYGGWVDAIIARVADIFIALPLLLGALVFLSVLKTRSVLTIAIVLVILIWPVIARIARGSVLSSKNLDYVQAARALGASNSRLMFKHILPNAIAPSVVYATIALGAFVSTEATLSFLGVGLQPPDVSWGIMISRGSQWVVNGSPHLLLFPGAFLLFTVLSFILLGDALRDALDPRLS